MSFQERTVLEARERYGSAFRRSLVQFIAGTRQIARKALQFGSRNRDPRAMKLLVQVQRR